ncbi:hypothetical protein T484DRAFT_1896488 [Baffinella frigidus]|nr:hypothetical protein T484DRAFT_1896488 [Cryptophyta sp. CCMP2293]
MPLRGVSLLLTDMVMRAILQGLCCCCTGGADDGMDYSEHGMFSPPSAVNNMK